MKDVKLKIEIEQLYIIDGISIDELLKRFGGIVSKKTLYTWKKKRRWDKRRERLSNLKTISKEKLFKLFDKAIDLALYKPTRECVENILLIKNIIEGKNVQSMVLEANISLKQFATIISEDDFSRVYSKIRRRVTRGFYASYNIKNHVGYIRSNDPAITTIERRKISEYLKSLPINQTF